jgi:hypothetical protein
VDDLFKSLEALTKSIEKAIEEVEEEAQEEKEGDLFLQNLGESLAQYLCNGCQGCGAEGPDYTSEENQLCILEQFDILREKLHKVKELVDLCDL